LLNPTQALSADQDNNTSAHTNDSIIKDLFGSDDGDRDDVNATSDWTKHAPPTLASELRRISSRVDRSLSAIIRRRLVERSTIAALLRKHFIPARPCQRDRPPGSRRACPGL